MKPTNALLRSLVLGAALAPAAALAQIQLPADHVDLGIGFHEGHLELHWHVEEPAPDGVEYAPSEAFIFVPLTSNTTVGAGYGFTGVAPGGTVYGLPEVQDVEVTFLGLGSEEIVNGTFVDNILTLTLASIEGPGVFSLWQEAVLGPSAFLSTAPGQEGLSFDLTTGGHQHFNWGFSAPGIYNLTFTVNGLLNDGLSTPVNDTATFTFAVGTPIPEPSSFAALAGLGVLGLAATRRRRV